jgi:hypothetical protein
MLKCIEEINEKNKRFKAYFTNGKTTKFGQSNPKHGTFLDHGDKTLKRNYIKRHLKDLETNDYMRAGYLSLFLLWNKETLKESMKDYNRRILKNDWDIKI